ncbi:MAG: anti-sigma factor [Gaiellaceae bacterium]
MSRRSVVWLALGAAAVGAGIVYLLDPVLGAVRRGATLAFLGLTPEHQGREHKGSQPAPETVAEAQAPATAPAATPDAATPEAPRLREDTSLSAPILGYDEAMRHATQPILTHTPAQKSSAAAPVDESGVRSPELRLLRERGLSGSILVALAAGMAVSALALGSWAFISKSGSTKTSPQAAGTAVERAIALLATPSAQQIALANSKGKMILVVAPDGNAVLVLNDFRRAPAGKTYEAWVIRPTPGAAPVPAATFSGSELVVPLTEAVLPGATVAVTVENAGGVDAPTQKPSLVAQRA